MPKLINYYNGLGELLTSECLSMFTHEGVDYFVVLDRTFKPTIITSEVITASRW